MRTPPCRPAADAAGVAKLLNVRLFLYWVPFVADTDTPDRQA